MKRSTAPRLFGPRLPVLGALALLLVACGDASEPPASSGNEPAPQVDADPTPQTGTGGSLPMSTPDGEPRPSPAQPAAGETPAGPPANPAD